MKKSGGKKTSSGKNITLKLNKTNIIVISVCVVVVAIILIIAFGGKKSSTQEEMEASSQEGETEKQTGLFNFFLKLFNASDLGDFELPDDVIGDGTNLPSDIDTNETTDTNNQSFDQVCGNTCAQNYNQKPYPDCSCYLPDTDTDNDGVNDDLDAFPNDATETQDTDGDGVGNNADDFPNDATETTDTDGDGVGDNSDAFPDDPEQWEASCSDTDGGVNSTLYGVCNNIDGEDNEDYCQDNQYLSEYACVGDGSCNETTIDCNAIGDWMDWWFCAAGECQQYGGDSDSDGISDYDEEWVLGSDPHDSNDPSFSGVPSYNDIWFKFADKDGGCYFETNWPVYTLTETQGYKADKIPVNFELHVREMEGDYSSWNTDPRYQDYTRGEVKQYSLTDVGSPTGKIEINFVIWDNYGSPAWYTCNDDYTLYGVS